MTNKNTKQYFVPVLLLLLLFVDAQLTGWVEQLMDNVYFASAHFVLLAFLMATLAYSRRYLFITALLLGILCDSYYLGVIGIYAVSLPVTVMMMYRFQAIVHTNLLTAFFGMVIFVTMYELLVIGLQVIFQLSNIMLSTFITRVLGPTLLFNMLLFVLFSYILKKIFGR